MRDYKRESEWQKQKYDTIRANIDKNLGKQFRAKLEKENKTISGWITNAIKKYLKRGVKE